MKFFLGSLLLCITCLSAFALENSKLNKYCEECLAKSLVSGYYEHPERCDAYVQCQYINKTLIAYEKFCNERTCYNKDTDNCDYCSKTTCQKKCKNPTRFKDELSCNKYFTCDMSGFDYEAKTCPIQHRFDKERSSCVPDSNCTGNAIRPCSETFKPSKTLGKFWQKDAEGWIEKDCGPGTGFDPKSCTCAKMIPVPEDKDCLLVDLPLEKNCSEFSHGWYVHKDGEIKFSNNAAQFTSDNALVIPALINNDLSNSVEISFRFYLKSSSEDSYSIVSNGNCNREPSVNIKVENANSFPMIVGFLKFKENTMEEIRTNVVLNQWYGIRFGKSGNSMRMYLDNNLVKEVINPGYIETVDSALSIGKPCSSNSFVGSVNKFKITKCPSW